MKYIINVIIVSLFFVNPMLAQKTPERPGNVKRSSEIWKKRDQENMNMRMDRALKMANMMADSLRLDEKQRKSIAAINSNIEQKKLEVWNKHKGDSETIGQKLNEIEKGRDAQYQGVLLSAQFKIYKAKKKIFFKGR